MRIEWSPRAAKDLRLIYRHIANDNPEAAERTTRAIVERTLNLSIFPRQGRPGPRPSTRELVLTPLPYILVYRVRDEFVEIVRIWHGAQNR